MKSGSQVLAEKLWGVEKAAKAHKSLVELEEGEVTLRHPIRSVKITVPPRRVSEFDWRRHFYCTPFGTDRIRHFEAWEDTFTSFVDRDEYCWAVLVVLGSKDDDLLRYTRTRGASLASRGANCVSFTTLGMLGGENKTGLPRLLTRRARK